MNNQGYLNRCRKSIAFTVAESVYYDDSVHKDEKDAMVNEQLNVMADAGIITVNEIHKYYDYCGIHKMEYHQGNTEMIVRHPTGLEIRLVSFPSDKQHGERFDRDCTIASLFLQNAAGEHEIYNKDITLSNIKETCQLLDDKRFSFHEVSLLLEELGRIEDKNKNYLMTLNK